MHYPEARKEVTPDVVRFVRKSPGMNFVSFTFANEQNLERVIDQQVDYFLPMQQPFTWKVYDHDLLPSLKDKLATRGFAGDADPAAVMVLRVKKAPASLFQPLTTLDLLSKSPAGSARVVPGAKRSGKTDIRRITDREGLKDIIHVLDRVYGGHNTWVNGRLGGHLQVPGYLSVYAAYVEDQPVSIGWTYFPRGQFASLFAGTTLAEYRKQGLYTSLIAARVQEIRERGYAYAVVEAGSMSKPILARHGFQHLTTVHDYEWKGISLQLAWGDLSPYYGVEVVAI
jgi:GNAT superfamily N-acetyltransferase